MPCIHSIQRSDSGHSIHARMPHGDAGKRGAMATYKGAERGMPRSHGNGRPQGRLYCLEIKACVGLEAVHLGGAVPFLDIPSTSFSLLVKQRCMTT